MGKNRIIGYISFAALVLAVVWNLYEGYAQRIVMALYERNTTEVFASIISGQKDFPVEYYYSITNTLFRCYFLAACVFAALFTLLLRVFRRDTVDALFDATRGTAMVVLAALAIKRILAAPFAMWNGARLAWAFALANGHRIYYSIDSGPVLSTMYGPLTPLVYLPATVAPTPTLAIVAGACISAMFYYLPVLWMQRTVEKKDKGGYVPHMFTVFCLLTFTTSSLAWPAFAVHADAPALGFGMGACVLLWRGLFRGKQREIFFSGMLVVFSICVKQTMVPLAIALPLYAIVTRGRGAFMRHAAGMIVTGTVVLAVLLYLYGAKDLYFNMVSFPLGAPWRYSKEPLESLFIAFTHLMKRGWLYAAFLAALVFHTFSKRGERSSGNKWALAALAALFLVPTTLVGRVRTGGAANTLSPALYFAAVSFTLGLGDLVGAAAERGVRTKKRARIFLMVFFGMLTLFDIRGFWNIRTATPDIMGNNHEMAFKYIRKNPGKAYFPNLPLPHLMAENKLYHFAVGIRDRRVAGFITGPEHFRANVPPNAEFIAFPASAARTHTWERMPEFTKEIDVEALPGWTVYGREDGARGEI